MEKNKDIYNSHSNPNHIPTPIAKPNFNPDPDNSQHYLCLSDDLIIPKKYIGQARCIKTNYPTRDRRAIAIFNPRDSKQQN